MCANKACISAIGVYTGQGWGGLVAHALASKLLLQLRQEIELAQKMGINLSALSQTEGKVRALQGGVSWRAAVFGACVTC